MEESQETYGYDTEMAEYKRLHPLITFKDVLIGQKIPWELRETAPGWQSYAV